MSAKFGVFLTPSPLTQRCLLLPGPTHEQRNPGASRGTNGRGRTHLARNGDEKWNEQPNAATRRLLRQQRASERARGRRRAGRRGLHPAACVVAVNCCDGAAVADRAEATAFGGRMDAGLLPAERSGRAAVAEAS